jgi:hypothetical protein
MNAKSLSICLLTVVGIWASGCSQNQANGHAMRLTPLGLPDPQGNQLYDVYIVGEADAKPGDPERETRRRQWLDIAMTSRQYNDYEVVDARTVPLDNPGLLASKVCEYHYTVRVKPAQAK